MKYNLLALALLITTIAVAQGNYKCMPFENISSWTQLYEIPVDSLQRIANSPMHSHTWQYEDCGDRNEQVYQWDDLVHYEAPCGVSSTSKERRICEVCAMFEQRTITTGLKQVYFISPFDVLKQKHYKQFNPQSVYEKLWRESYQGTWDTLINYPDTIKISDIKKYYLPNDHK